MKPSLLLVWFLSLISATSATADPGDALDRQIDTLLSGYEYVPPASAWARLGPKAAARLRAIAEDDHIRPSKRLRALSALAHFPTAETREFLDRILDNEQRPSLMRRKAVLSLAAGFGPSALPMVSKHAASNDVRLRDDVVRALARIQTPEARAVLQARQQHEKTYVRRTIAQKLNEGR